MTRRQKKKLVKFLAAICFVICLGTLFGTIFVQSQKIAGESLPAAKEEVVKEDSVPVISDNRREEFVTETEETIEETAEEIPEEEHLPDDWNLILVNRTHPVPDDYEVELKEIGDGHQVDARIYEEFRDMIRAAKAEGIYLYVTSSYRDMDKQIELHEKKIETFVMQGYSYEQAKEKAAEIVAVPGTSEHHLGLALDFVSSEYKKLDKNQESTRSFQWLKEHCAEYGFILRYPNDKTEITGIIYEPWHFRYVGKEAAEVIMDAGITLEEYLGASPVTEAGENS